MAMDGERLQTLTAMGVDVYLTRGRDIAFEPEATGHAALLPGALVDRSQAGVQLVAVCGHGVRSDARLAALFKHLPRIFGIADEAIHWLEADAQGALASPLDAPAYLVFGAPMARALGVQLSTMQQKCSVIAVTAEPAQLSGDAMSKRALWQVLKPLARRLRARTD